MEFPNKVLDLQQWLTHLLSKICGVKKRVETPSRKQLSILKDHTKDPSKQITKQELSCPESVSHLWVCHVVVAP